MSSNPGFAKYSRRSLSLGIGSWGSFRVRNVLRYSQSQSTIFSSLPKHLLSVASCRSGQRLPKYKVTLILTCDKTTTPSFVTWTSVSIACAPTSTAPANAPIVFSGYAALYPLCAIACGLLPLEDRTAPVNEVARRLVMGQPFFQCTQNSHIGRSILSCNNGELSVIIWTLTRYLGDQDQQSTFGVCGVWV